MKKKVLFPVIAVALCASLTLPSCIGSFGLTQKLMTWNKNIGNKFVNELVFIAFWIVPVYEVSALADILVINSIEFWSGDNPVAHKGKKVVEGQNGRYLVDCDGQGYTITNLGDKKSMRFDYHSADQSWWVSAQGKTVKLFSFVDDKHVSMLQADGTYSVVTLSQPGVLSYQQTAAADFLAAR